VLATCDASDGSKDDVVSNPVACKKAFDARKLSCPAGQSGDGCLNAAQVKAVQTLQSPYKFGVELANGLDDYPGWGVSGEATPGDGATGGWSSWWVGTSPPVHPSLPTNGRSWQYGSGAIRHIFARNPALDPSLYKPADHLKRIRQVSNLMDATNPDLSAFADRGGKLIMLEYMADYAQSPYAGIRYYENVVKDMGLAPVRRFMRLYTAPGVDHVGTGAPGNVDMLSALSEWVEKGKAPGALLAVEQSVEAAPRLLRGRPLCQWPQWPKYTSGDANMPSSFECVR
jgi:Tannase and feruloyl esterase